MYFFLYNLPICIFRSSTAHLMVSYLCLHCLPRSFSIGCWTLMFYIFNPFALKTAKTFGHSGCKRVKPTHVRQFQSHCSSFFSEEIAKYRNFVSKILAYLEHSTNKYHLKQSQSSCSLFLPLATSNSSQKYFLSPWA